MESTAHNLDSGSSNSKYFIICRHGERLDYLKTSEIDNMINAKDPGLSKAGVEQAAISGKYLADFLKERNATRIKVITSPMTRTIQTASEIALQVGVNEVTLNNGFIEWMVKPYFLLEIDEMEFRTRDEEDYRKTYLQDKHSDIKYTDLKNYTAELTATKPESDIQIAKDRIIEYSKKFYENKEAMEDYDAVIAVSHLFSVEALSQHFKGDGCERGYCTMSAIHIDNSTVSLFLKPKCMNNFFYRISLKIRTINW